MALKKDMVLDNGITVSYHRIVSMNHIINKNTTIEVGSYINKEQRDKEKEWYAGNCESDLNVFISTVYYMLDYNEGLTVIDAYEYLKTLDVFSDAEDIFESPEETIEEVVIPEESMNNEEN